MSEKNPFEQGIWADPKTVQQHNYIVKGKLSLKDTVELSQNIYETIVDILDEI